MPLYWELYLRYLDSGQMLHRLRSPVQRTSHGIVQALLLRSLVRIHRQGMIFTFKSFARLWASSDLIGRPTYNVSIALSSMALPDPTSSGQSRINPSSEIPNDGSTK